MRQPTDESTAQPFDRSTDADPGQPPLQPPELAHGIRTDSVRAPRRPVPSAAAGLPAACEPAADPPRDAVAALERRLDAVAARSAALVEELALLEARLAGIAETAVRTHGEFSLALAGVTGRARRDAYRSTGLEALDRRIGRVAEQLARAAACGRGAAVASGGPLR